MCESDPRQAGVLREAEALIAKWDQESGMTYRELARALFDIYHGLGEGGHESL
jgi:hypothetical protein